MLNKMKLGFRILVFAAMCFIFAYCLLGCANSDSEKPEKICFKIGNETYGYRDISADGSFSFPDQPTMEEHRFDGWYYTDKDGEKVKLTDDYRFTEGDFIITVYAEFSVIGKNVVKYELNGGKNSKNNPTICYDTMIGENAVTLEAPTKVVLSSVDYDSVGFRVKKTERYKKYDFLGWFIDSGFNTEICEINYRAGDITVYAKWSEEYTEEIVTTEDEFIVDGKAVYMGAYPQGRVDDNLVLQELNSRSGELPSASDRKNWTSYGFYVDDVKCDYTWYQDIELDGVRYRGIYFTEYRPDNVEYALPEISQQEKNGYVKNNVYWFKYEPIKWDVLHNADGTALLYSDLILDAVAWQENVVSEGKIKYINDGIAPDKTYANNYEYSSIRRLLNGDFYNFAFSEAQRSIIKTVLTDNSVKTSFVDPNPYLCSDTEDRIFLLSYRDLINAEYGFDASYSKYDESRRKTGSDYADALGLRHSSGEYEDNAAYWLRTPFYDSANVPHLVRETGYSTAIHAATESCVGLVPAMYIVFE